MQPPGRATRKARDFGAEIARLRAQGYTLEAIRQALMAAGIHVSISTVRREAGRCAAPDSVPAALSGNTPGIQAVSPPLAVAWPVPQRCGTPNSLDERSGKQIAEAFMRNRITNPLIRSKEQT